MPKFNMYQSLHTTVIGPPAAPLEIQIRTQEMHRTAEYGIAAHWRYKEGGDGDERSTSARVAAADARVADRDSRTRASSWRALKIDLFEDEVFVFTPKGDVMSLAAGRRRSTSPTRSTPRSATTRVGAKVNGAIVPLHTSCRWATASTS